MWRICCAGALCLAWMALASAPAGAATFTLTLKKNVARGGSVVDDAGQISCGTSCLSDTGAYAEECEFDPELGRVICFPQVPTLTATPASGWSVSWSGCSSSGNQCSVFMNTNRTVTATFTDVTNPTASLTQPATGSVVAGPVTLAATASDNDAVARVEFLVRGVEVGEDTTAPYSVSFDTRGVADGSATVVARAIDFSGRSESSATRTITIDNTAPSVSITSGPAAGATIGPPGSVNFAFSATDATSGVQSVQCALDLGPFGACTGASSHALTGLGDGSHTFFVRAVDKAGNVGPAATRTFKVDLTPPDTTIDSGPAEGSTVAATSAEFGFGATETATFQCRLYAVGTTPPAFVPCSGPDATHVAAGLGDGTYQLEVRAVDAVGNVDPSPATRTFTIDLTAPDTSIDSGPTEGSSSTAASVTFTFSANEPGSTFQCRLHIAGTTAPAFGPCSGAGSHSLSGLSPGTYVFEVKATDAVGNSDATPAARVFTVLAQGGTGTGGTGTGGTGPGGTGPGGTGATPALKRVNSTVSQFYAVRGAATKVLTLTVRKLPAGASVKLRCRGRGCPFRSRTVAPRRGRAVLAPLFGKTRLRAGAVLEVRMTAANRIGKVLRISFRAGKLPRRQPLCLRPGDASPAAC